MLNKELSKIKLTHFHLFCRRSQELSRQFRALCDQFGLPQKKLVMDTRTRWNSTYVMVQTGLRYIQVYNKTILSVEVTSKVRLLEVSEEEIACLRALLDVLEPINEATKWASGDR